MPRYEISDGRKDRFWEIKLVSDTSFTTTFGRIGERGQTKLKELATAEATKAAYDKIVAEKRTEGYQLAGGPKTRMPCRPSGGGPIQMCRSPRSASGSFSTISSTRCRA